MKTVYDIILTPVLTEKSYAQFADRKYTFKVDINANKFQIKEAVEKIFGVEVEKVGPLFEHSPLFPERVNTEFIRVVNPVTIKMRVWERGNGETLACGTGACAAVVAAVENGFCKKGEDITVKVKGGDLIVNYTDEGITLTGNAQLVYKGELEY